MPHVNIAIENYIASIAQIACPTCQGPMTLAARQSVLNFDLRRFGCESCDRVETTVFEKRAEGWRASTDLRSPT